MNSKLLPTGKLKPITKKNIITLIILSAVFGAVYILLSAGFIGSLYKGLLVPICIYIILAISLNLVVGFLGELSLGHAGFMCIGAYTSSIFSLYFQDSIPSALIRFPLALIVGGICAAIFGLIIGIPVLRLSGDYLAIVTLAFGEIIKNFANVLYIGSDKYGLHISLTNAAALKLDTDTGKVILDGAQGISGTPRDSTFLIAVIIIIITLIIIMTLTDSKTGRAITAIRDNRIAAESLGINITKYKLLGFVISAFFAGLAGVLYSHNFSILAATTKNFGYNQSIMVLVFVVLGGMGNFNGTIIATVLLYALPEVLRSVSPKISDYRMLIYSIILIGAMLLSNNRRFADFRHLIKDKFFRKNISGEAGK